MLVKVTKPSTYPKEDFEAKRLAAHLYALQKNKAIKCFSHIANETNNIKPQYMAKMKQLGKSPGVPDYVIVAHKVFFIELKRQQNENGTSASVTSPAQIMWQQALNDAGCQSYIAYGADAAINIVQNILKNKD